MPGNLNLTIWKGNSYSQPLRLSTRDGDNDLVPVGLAGSELVFVAAWRGGTLRKSTADEDGFSITDAANGRVLLSLTKVETRALPPGRTATYEIERRTGGEQTTILYGDIITTGGTNDD